jgi:uncharacterized membrane protein
MFKNRFAHPVGGVIFFTIILALSIWMYFVWSWDDIARIGIPLPLLALLAMAASLYGLVWSGIWVIRDRRG